METVIYKWLSPFTLDSLLIIYIFSSTVALAAAFPDLELFISLCGAIFLSSLGLLIPAVVETVHKWDRGLGFLNWILWKNCFIGLLSLVALFAGSYVSIKGIIEKFNEPVYEKLLNGTLNRINETLTLQDNLNI